MDSTNSLTAAQRRQLRELIAQAIYRKNAADGQRTLAIHVSRSEVVRAIVTDLAAAGWKLVPPASEDTMT